MTTNINPDTGIAYGFISANALDPETVDRLQRDLSIEYHDSLKEFLAGLTADPETGEPLSDDDREVLIEEFKQDWEIEEPTHEGTIDCPGYGPVQYRTSWLGGALNVWIFKSPFTTDKARRASPCVPNAGILDTLDGGVQAYDVPADWRLAE